MEAAEREAAEPPPILVRRGHKLKGKIEADSEDENEEDLKNKARNEESVHRNVKEFSRILKRKTTTGHAEGVIEEDDAEALDQQVMNQNRKNIKTSPCTIFPDSSFKTFWDLISFAFTIYQSIIIPFRISFNVAAEGFFKYSEYSMDFFFISEIFIQFNTGYYSKGNLIMQRSWIIINYL